MIKKRLSYLFVAMLFFAMLFCVDPDTLVGTANANIVVPFISLKVSIVMFAVTMFGLLLVVTNKKIKLDTILLILLVRLLLYFIPMIYMKESFALGTALAVFQCFIVYFIGLNLKIDFSGYIKILILVSLFIICEEVYVLINRGITIFSPSLKYYMVLPLGRYNYITCFLLPIYFLVDSYYKSKRAKVVLLKLAYMLLILFGILATGSKLSLLIFVGYIFMKSIRMIKKNFILAFLGVSFIIVFLIANGSMFSKYFTTATFAPRLNVYYEGIHLFLKHPILGRGAVPYQIYDAVSAHNFILEALIQTGIIGAILYLAVLILVIKIFRSIKDKKLKRVSLTFLIGVLVQGLAEPALFGLCFDTFFWLCIGFLVGQSRKSQRDEMFLF